MFVFVVVSVALRGPEEAPHRSGMADTSNDCPQSTQGEGEKEVHTLTLITQTG